MATSKINRPETPAGVVFQNTNFPIQFRTSLIAGYKPYLLSFNSTAGFLYDETQGKDILKLPRLNVACNWAELNSDSQNPIILCVDRPDGRYILTANNTGLHFGVWQNNNWVNIWSINPTTTT